MENPQKQYDRVDQHDGTGRAEADLKGQGLPSELFAEDDKRPHKHQKNIGGKNLRVFKNPIHIFHVDPLLPMVDSTLSITNEKRKHKLYCRHFLKAF